MTGIAKIDKLAENQNLLEYHMVFKQIMFIRIITPSSYNKTPPLKHLTLVENYLAQYIPAFFEEKNHHIEIHVSAKRPGSI